MGHKIIKREVIKISDIKRGRPYCPKQKDGENPPPVFRDDLRNQRNA